ncbi:alcohol dehydrogenase [Sulfolobus sp. A20]|uniref:alcohol dehydrogenase catalytic domain-containing protein n=1 Tax=Sulfolobaceae TaxID=118883 RepID=UPI000845BD01|nr:MULTISPECIES: alcohol dehydrogenase catalytic domain-containing protein [unclassified Sulfolobus]TRM75722.1 alcohol dehydrogenase [Sulfolobus sp. A20-N-F8]TRM78841.1 alcohol dehydrogenase [Sulfolobus sp. B5]TRM81242.1 alcohol dehydrogenase [Sulfolobus sp. D5]TRM83470.1 alcohol dehydrogenase [Sulfolobus sp. A20-N-F6]TRM87366.1 alcohol dehydrogenase [Sulfolobus sp. C3]TRM95218.1 alcohol dehydrogenase [Sulfolobus sp. A20-N-G8]TRN02995.1 alcohol dehydrogenase [Sulfolobus sp. F1]TRN04800.1 al
MKALVFDKNGIENLRYTEYKDPEVKSHDVLIKVEMAGVNPVDYYTVNSLKVNPLPHIPGVEFSGEVAKVGDHVKSVKVGDKVTIYGRIFDGTCDMCMAGYETVCRNGGRIGVDANGGFAEYVAVEEKYVFKLPDEYSWEMGSSLTVASLTAYHALKEANLRPSETVIVFGASGNTGMFIVQLAKKFGAKVIAVSRKSWLKDFGADLVVSYDEVEEKVKDFTKGKMGDVVINSLGSQFWDKSFSVVGLKGRIVTFGTLLGAEVKVNLSQLYSKHISILGVNRGNRKDFVELLDLCRDCKVKTWKIYNLENGVEALKGLFDEKRDGRIFISMH